MAYPFSDIPDRKLEPGTVLLQEYIQDPNRQMNLLNGTYELEDGSTFVPQSVMQAREQLLCDPTWHHAYPPFIGQRCFLESCERLFFGLNSRAVRTQGIVSMQAIGATGACHMGACFLKAYYQPWKELKCEPTIYMSAETWANHPNVFRGVGINVTNFTYYDSVTKSLNFDGMKEEIGNLAPYSVILLQTSAHNPTGCDPTIDQWQELAEIFLQKRHFAFLDCSYFGLVNGNTDTVSESGGIRIFEDRGIPLLLAASFSKNFGLYAERIGVVSLITPPDEGLKSRIRKQFTFLARSQTGASPSFGSKIVTMILTNSELRQQWDQDIAGMATETQYRRRLLQAELQRIEAPGDWDFLTDHVGMFSLLGLHSEHVKSLRCDYHIYIDPSGRVCFGSLKRREIPFLASAISQVLLESTVKAIK